MSDISVNNKNCIYTIGDLCKQDFQQFDLKGFAQQLDPWKDPTFVLRINDDLLRAYTRGIIEFYFTNKNFSISELEQVFVNHFYDLFLSKINILWGKESKYKSNDKVFMPPFIKYAIDCIGSRKTYDNDYDTNISEHIPEIQIINPNYIEWTPHSKEDLCDGPPDEECYRKWVYLNNYNQDRIDLRYGSDYSSIEFLFNSFIEEKEGNDNVMFGVVDHQIVSITSHASVLDILVATLLGVNGCEFVQQRAGRREADYFKSYGHILNFHKYYRLMAFSIVPYKFDPYLFNRS